LLQCEVLVLAVYEGPNLVALETAHAEIANVGIVICGSSAAYLLQELQDGMLGDSGHLASGIDGRYHLPVLLSLALFST